MHFSAAAIFSMALAPLAIASPTPGPVPPPSEKFKGTMRYYTPDGAFGSCGFQNTSSQAVVALSAIVMKNGPNPNTNPICGHKIVIKHGGKKVKGTVVDTCPSCAEDDFNVSPEIFEQFAPLSTGAIQNVKWNFEG